MTDSPFALTAILWWEILNMVLYTALAVFGLAATIVGMLADSGVCIQMVVLEWVSHL